MPFRDASYRFTSTVRPATLLTLVILLCVLPSSGRLGAIENAHVYLEKSSTGQFELIHEGIEVSVVLSTRDSITAPALSPDNRLVVFSAAVGDGSLGRYALFIVDVITLDEEQLTTGSLGELDPVWSPDGQSIFFSANTSGGLSASSCCRLANIDLESGTITYLTDAVGAVRPDISPDGQLTLFDTPAGLFTVPANGDTPTLIAAGGRDGAFSPDGSFITYIATNGGMDDLRQIPISGGPSATVYSPSGSLESPVWVDERIFVVEYSGSGYDGRQDVKHISLDPDGSNVELESEFTSAAAELDVGTKDLFGIAGVPSLAEGIDDDGTTDIANYHPSTGNWVVSRSTGSGFTNSVWTSFSTKTGWTQHLTGDFNGDGRTDIANYHPSTGNWVVSRSTGSGFTNSVWTSFSTKTGWTQHLTGDFNGDGRTDIANYHPSTGNWVVSRSTGTGFTNNVWND